MAAISFTKERALEIAGAIRGDYKDQAYTSKDGRVNLFYDVFVLPIPPPAGNKLIGMYSDLINNGHNYRPADTRTFIDECPATEYQVIAIVAMQPTVTRHFGVKTLNVKEEKTDAGAVYLFDVIEE